jgi:hypothetical protein
VAAGVVCTGRVAVVGAGDAVAPLVGDPVEVVVLVGPSGSRVAVGVVANIVVVVTELVVGAAVIVVVDGIVVIGGTHSVIPSPVGATALNAESTWSSIHRSDEGKAVAAPGKS